MIYIRDQGPHQTPVPLENEGMARVYLNKKHSTGGLYLETGGSLVPKEIGNFVTIGLNAVLQKQNNPLDPSSIKKEIVRKFEKRNQSVDW